MRLLAKELRISVITTKRAYEELEREGFIFSITGKGSYVATKNKEFVKESQLKEIENYMQEITRCAKIGAIDFSELLEMMKTIYEEE